VERDQERDRGDQGAETGPRLAGVRAEDAQAGGRAPAAVGDQEHREPGADREGDRDGDALAPAERRRMRRNRSEHEPAARHEDETEGQAQDEAAAEIPARSARQSGERALEHLAKLRDDQRRRDDEEEGDREIPEEVLRQVQLSEQPGDGKEGSGEADDDSGDDGVGPSRSAAARAPGEDDGQDRQPAR
jgi:hypothetical protein